MREISYVDDFNPIEASEAQILARATKLKGKRIRELALTGGVVAERSPADKGLVGQLVERFFAIKQNSDSAPDFVAAGIELKVVPLKVVTRPKRRMRAKERTFVTMISYPRLIDEEWGRASVRKKVDRILFVYYHHDPALDPLDYPIIATILWSPTEDLSSQFERDWTVVRAKVDAGSAHRISERDGRVLGAATKGAGGTFVVQPRSPEMAKPRAWALKPSLTTWILEEHSKRPSPQESLAEALHLIPGEDFEAALLARLHAAAGMSMIDLSRRLGVPLSRGKANAALIVRRLLGLIGDRTRIKEFEQHGILVKTVPVSPDGKDVFESMSFARFHHLRIVDDTWESSDLRADLQRLLVVPIVRRWKREPAAEWRLGKPFFWSPSDAELDAMGSEWERFVALIRDGKAARLPTAATTEFIHVRPKGRNRKDTEPAPGLDAVMKRCFWLNFDYVERIIAANLPGGAL